MGNKRLYDIMKEKDALYEKEDFSDEDGIKAAELEAEFAEMDGWEADSNASKANWIDFWVLSGIRKASNSRLLVNVKVSRFLLPEPSTKSICTVS